MKRTICLALLIIFCLPLLCLGAKKNILVIESYHAEYPWDISYKEGLEQVLGKSYHLLYFPMDTKRIPASEFKNRAQLAFEEYQRINPELVILGDDNALKFVGPKLAGKKTPVVYLGINQNPRNYNMFGPANITGVLERPLMKRSILYFKEILNPQPKKILVLFDTGATSRSSVQMIFRGKNSTYIGGIRTDLRLIGKLSDWENTVLSSKTDGYDAIIVGLYHTITDEAGNHADAGSILEWTSRNTPLPPFCFWDFTVGPKKTIGGLVLFGKIQGQTAGRTALKILSGTRPKDIHPVAAEKGRLLFSKSQLKKWKIKIPNQILNEVEYID